MLEGIKSLDLPHYHQDLDQVELKKPIIPILKFSAEQDSKGWKYSYESGNGIQAEETGYIKNHGDEKHESVVQQGSITYHDEHGHPITLHYIADEHGFRPQGYHLPTPPPIPEDIQKSMDHEEDKIEVNEEEEYQKKEQAQAQSYAESQVHSKTVYDPEQNHGRRQEYRYKGQNQRHRQHQRFIIRSRD